MDKVLQDEKKLVKLFDKFLLQTFETHFQKDLTQNEFRVKNPHTTLAFERSKIL